ncbi:hypothetical protein [Paraferrimonas sp. SM1919]|uniref:hypothetical protein n=1 Tax=Paraferrimonas sp. SM1919 TaxID=2662263 RepID=UPI0013D147E5|nr:hypothetical protein [Paraferrimonas sp. SM1919]
MTLLHWIFVGIFICYIAVHYYNNKEIPSLEKTVTFILSSFAIYHGILLIIKTFGLYTQAVNFGDLEKDRLAIGLGGFAIVWVSASSIISQFKTKHED